MTEYRAPVSDLEFLLFDVFKIDESGGSGMGVDLDRDTVRSLLHQCARLAEDVMAPLSSTGDQEGARWHEGEVTAPQGFKAAFEQLSEGGWLSVSGNPEFGGQGLPKSVTAAFEEMFWGANTNLWLYGALTSGACYCIDAHAAAELKASYLPQMYAGKWTGAMALTEAHAGTDLGMLRTRAELQPDASYRITGTKIFITSGEHNLAENIVHLVLARIQDAPAGTRGISLFLVPKFLLAEDGSIAKRNRLASGSIEHKMGIRGSATSVINYDGATGFLVGAPNRGLQCMFTMMNYARLSVGVQGMGLAEAAYQRAASYAKERLQGRAIAGLKSRTGADAIVEHADVRRMLLTQRAYTEGSRAFSLLVSGYLDGIGDENPLRGQNIRAVELLTPIAKAFITDRAMESALLAQQCFGGHGYIVESGIEQIVRDVRITQIYEGTNGVQALDLINRKILADGGSTLAAFIANLKQHETDPAFELEMTRALEEWWSVTAWLVEQYQDRPELPGAAATPYLSLSGHAIYAWLWARMSRVDDHERGKKHLARFYFDQLLPRLYEASTAIRSGEESLVAPASEWF